MKFKKTFILLFSFISLFLFIGCNQKKSVSRNLNLENINQLNSDTFTCTFDGIEHDFIVELPVQKETSENDAIKSVPLVILLPGYSNTADHLRFTTGFHKEANSRGYAAVYVTGSISKYEKTGGLGWNSGIAAKGNPDVEFIVALTEYLRKEYGFDKERTFVAGFSNGGFMIHRLAMEAGNTFRAVACVAGKMPEKVWNNRNRKNHIGVMQITGEKDDVVPKRFDGTENNSRDPAIEDVMDYWALSNGLKNIAVESVARGSKLTKWSSGNKDRQVWHLLVKDSHHFWPTEQINGIDGNTVILDFFDAN